MIEIAEIQRQLSNMRQLTPPGSVWKHKKGGLYMVLGVSWDTEKDWVVVNYFRIGGPGYNKRDETGLIFARPAYMWTEDRFTKVSPFNAG